MTVLLHAAVSVTIPLQIQVSTRSVSQPKVPRSFKMFRNHFNSKPMGFARVCCRTRQLRYCERYVRARAHAYISEPTASLYGTNFILFIASSIFSRISIVSCTFGYKGVAGNPTSLRWKRPTIASLYAPWEIDKVLNSRQRRTGLIRDFNVLA